VQQEVTTMKDKTRQGINLLLLFSSVLVITVALAWLASMLLGDSWIVGVIGLVGWLVCLKMVIKIRSLRKN
jgi:hypothetical protein